MDPETGHEPSPFATHNVIAKILDAPAPRSRLLRAGRLWAEGLVYTACGLLIASAIQVPQAGFFAVFLAAAGLAGRLDGILDENRRAIFIARALPWRANRRAALDLLMLFLGVFSTFAGAALWLGEARLAGAFDFVAGTASLGRDSILTRPFASPLGLVIHNLLVLAVFFALSFVYRSYGAALVLCWNACAWGLVLAFLVRRGMVASHVHPAIFVAVSMLAVLPHLVLEASAYVTGALAAIFLSKAAFKYAPWEAVFRAVLRATSIMLAASVACVIAGAAVEATLPRWILALLLRGSGSR